MGTQKILKSIIYIYYVQMSNGGYVKYASSRPLWDNWSDEVVRAWREGPKGGIKLMRDNTLSGDYGYITNCESKMKDFMWAKLSAKQAWARL